MALFSGDNRRVKAARRLLSFSLCLLTACAGDPPAEADAGVAAVWVGPAPAPIDALPEILPSGPPGRPDAAPPAPDAAPPAPDAALPAPDAALPAPDAFTTDAAVSPPAPDAAAPAPDPDAAPPPDAGPNCAPEAAPCDRALFDRARDYATAYPLRDGATWHLWCASLMWRFGEFPEASVRASAILAAADSDIRSDDPTLAPQGALHWWDIGADGHVGMDLLGGGHTVFMATRHLRETWGDALGINGVSAYSAETGATYLGWSPDYVGARIAGGGGEACAPPTAVPEGCPVPRTDTEQTGVPDLSFWMRMQLFARANAYPGAIDGLMTRAAWAGVQRGLRAHGYAGPDDGLPGTNTFMALQRAAARHGYAGPIDGEPGPNTWRGFAALLNLL